MSQLSSFTTAGVAGVASVTAGTNLTNSGTAANPIIDLDATITLTAVNATTFDTNVAAAGVTLAGTTLSADGTDVTVDINVTPKGAAGQLVTTRISATDYVASDQFFTSTAATGLTITDNTIEADGTDAAININLTPKGAGVIAGTELTLTTALAVTSGGTGLATATQGDLLYGSAANTYSALAKDATATRYLANTGVTNNPAWDQVNLGNGITGTLAVANGGTSGVTHTIYGVLVGQDAAAIATTAAGTNGQCLLGSTTANPAFGTLGSTLGTVQYTTGAASLALDVQTAQSFTGFASWDGAGPYFDDTVLGDFEVSESGVGYIKGKKVTWAAPQTETGMTAGNTYYIYIDSAGTIGKTDTHSSALFRDNIVLFECMRDSTAGTNIQVTVKENHPYQVPYDTSVYLHDTIGTTITKNGGGANIVIDGTQKIAISGADELEDHGLETDIPDSGGTGVVWRKYFTLGSGKWAQQNATDTFTGYYNNAGTATALGANKYGVYKLYVSKDNITVTTPVYFAILHTAQFNNLASAQTAIADGTIAGETGELAALEMARLGYIIYAESSSSIVQVIIDKETIGLGGTMGGTNLASLVLTNVTNFNNLLSASDTTVQAALETIDDMGDPITVPHGGTAVATLLDGGLMVGAGTAAVEVLAVGGTGTILTGVGGANPTWTTATYPATATKGDIISASAANVFTAITAGTDNHVLTANGAGEVSTYQYSHALPITIADKNDSYALVEGDEGKMITMSKGTAQTLTVPKDATNDLAIGCQILVMQLGAGALTIAAEDGTIVLRYDAALTLVVNAQYAVAALVKIAANLWVVGGNLTPA